MNGIRTICTLVLLAVLVGCAHNAADLRPGAYNTFDQNTHDFLRVTHDTMDAAYKDVHPLADSNPIKIAYNAGIDALNAAQAGYIAYHAALDRHEAPDQSSVQALLDGLKAAVARYVATRAKPTAELWDWRRAECGGISGHQQRGYAA